MSFPAPPDADPRAEGGRLARGHTVGEAFHPPCQLCVILSREDGEGPSPWRIGRSFAVFAAQDDTGGAAQAPRRHAGGESDHRRPLRALAGLTAGVGTAAPTSSVSRTTLPMIAVTRARYSGLTEFRRSISGFR